MNFKVIRDDIINVSVDAVVLPANKELKEGGGTSKAIFEKAGRAKLTRACKRYKEVPVGSSVPTEGFDLNAQYILHTVVPKWRDGEKNEYELLSVSYMSALKLADELKCTTVAFPLLASGYSGFDIELAWEIAKESIESYVPRNNLKDIYMVIYGMEVMSMLKEKEIDVEEFIDESYVLNHDRRYIRPGQQIAENIVDTLVDKVQKYLSDPQNVDKLIESGKKIVDKIKERKKNINDKKQNNND